jgi:hypothetical protein
MYQPTAAITVSRNASSQCNAMAVGVYRHVVFSFMK